MSKLVNNSISATNLANRAVNKSLYSVTIAETKNAQPLSAFEFGLESSKEKKHQTSLQMHNDILSINTGLVSPQKNAQLLFGGAPSGAQIGEYEHNRFALEAELINGDQLRVITRHRVIMCFITTVLALTVIVLTKYN